MKRSLSVFFSVLLFCLVAVSHAGTYPLTLIFSAGAANTGLASSVQVTITDSAGTALVTASNNPSGSSAFTESSVAPGTYSAPYTVTTTNLPVKADFNFGAGTSGASAVYLTERAALVADGYTAGLTTTITSTNTQTTAANQQANTTAALNTAAPETPTAGSLFAEEATDLTNSTTAANIYTLLSPLISAGKFTTTALSLAPTSGGGTDPWATAFPGTYAAGTFGYAFAALPAAITGVPALTVTAMKADTVLARTFNRSHGAYTYNLTTHQMTLLNDDGTTLATVTLTQDPTTGTITGKQ